MPLRNALLFMSLVVVLLLDPKPGFCVQISSKYANLTTGQTITVNGTTYTVVGGSGGAYTLKGPNGGTFYIRHNQAGTYLQDPVKRTYSYIDNQGQITSTVAYKYGTNAAGQRTLTYTYTGGPSIQKQTSYTWVNGQWMTTGIKIVDTKTNQTISNLTRQPGQPWTQNATNPGQFSAGSVFSASTIKALQSQGININANTPVSFNGFNFSLSATNKNGQNVQIWKSWWDGANRTYITSPQGGYYALNNQGTVVSQVSTTYGSKGWTTTSVGNTSGITSSTNYIPVRNAAGRVVGYQIGQQYFNPLSGAFAYRTWNNSKTRAPAFQYTTTVNPNAKLMGVQYMQMNTPNGSRVPVYLYSDGSAISMTASGMVKINPPVNGKSQVTLYDLQNPNTPLHATLTYGPNGQPAKLTGTLPNGSTFTVQYGPNGQPLTMKVVAQNGVVTTYKAQNGKWVDAAGKVLPLNAYVAANPFAGAAGSITNIVNANVGGLLPTLQQANQPFARMLLFVTSLVNGSLGKLIALLGILIGTMLIIRGEMSAGLRAVSVVLLMAFGMTVITALFGG